MIIRITSLCLLFAVCSAGVNGEETALHPKVEYALGYELPDKKCKQPKQRNDSRFSVQQYQNELQGYLQCDADYANQLGTDFEALFSSAQHGLSQDQAKTILTKIRVIQDTLETEDKARKDYLKKLRAGSDGPNESLPQNLPRIGS